MRTSFLIPLRKAGLLAGLAYLLSAPTGNLNAQCANLLSNHSLEPTTSPYNPAGPFAASHVLPWSRVLGNPLLQTMPNSGAVSAYLEGTRSGANLTTDAIVQVLSSPLVAGESYGIAMFTKRYDIPTTTGPGAVQVILTHTSLLPTGATLWSAVTNPPPSSYPAPQVIINQTPTGIWQSANNCFTADAAWNCIVICSFAATSSTQKVLVDDVQLFEIVKPDAGPDQCANGTPVTIGTSVCSPAVIVPPVYSWTVLGNSSVISTSAQMTVNPSVTTTYVLKKTVGSCSFTDNVVVKGPATNFTKTIFLCGNSGPVTADAVDAGTNTFIWDSDPAIVATSANTAVVSITSTTVLRVNEYDPSGCLVSTSEITVTEAPEPLEKLVSICNGSVVELATDYVDGTTYSWAHGGTAHTSTVSVAGTYTVTKTYPGGCVVTDEFEVRTVECCEGDVAASNFYRRLDENFSYPYEFKHSALTSDGGMIICATFDNSGNNDIYLVKFDKDGRREWGAVYPYSGDEMATSVIQTHDGNYIVGGTSNSFGAANREIFLMKTDPLGTQLWLKTYPKAMGAPWARVAITQLNNDNIVLASNADHSSVSNVFVFHETDPDGVSLYTSYYELSRLYVTIEDITATSDGGLIALGSCGTTGDYFGSNVIKMDNTLNVTWANVNVVPSGSGSYSLYSGNPLDRTYAIGRSIIETNHATKKYLVTGFHSDAMINGGSYTSYNAIAFRLSGTGVFQDGREYLINNQYSVFFDITKKGSYDFFVGGGSRMFTNQRNVVAVMDSSLHLDVNNFNYFGTGNTNSVHNVFTSSTGEHSLTGFTSDFSGVPQPYYSKLDATLDHFCTDEENLVNTITFASWKQENFEDQVTENDLTLITEVDQALSEDRLCIPLLDVCYNYCDGIELAEVLNEDPYLGVAPVFLTFPGITYDYSLNFGDGSGWSPTYTSGIITHAYAAHGTYTVCLRVNIYLNGVLVNTCEICRDFEMPSSLRFSATSVAKQVAGQEYATVYPNPSGGAATIEFSLAEAETVNIVVYDLAGKQVAVLASGSTFQAGINRVTFNAETLSSGTYICKLTGNNSNYVIRFVKE